MYEDFYQFLNYYVGRPSTLSGSKVRVEFVRNGQSLSLNSESSHNVEYDASDPFDVETHRIRRAGSIDWDEIERIAEAVTLFLSRSLEMSINVIVDRTIGMTKLRLISEDVDEERYPLKYKKVILQMTLNANDARIANSNLDKFANELLSRLIRIVTKNSLWQSKSRARSIIKFDCMRASILAALGFDPSIAISDLSNTGSISAAEREDVILRFIENYDLYENPRIVNIDLEEAQKLLSNL